MPLLKPAFNPLPFILFFIITNVSYAVSEQELDALELMIQKKEEQDRLESVKNKPAESKTDTRKKSITIPKTGQNKPQQSDKFSWQTYKDLEGKWGVAIETNETTQMIFYNTDITLENEKLIFTGVNGNITHRFNIFPGLDKEAIYIKTCEYDTVALEDYLKVCSNSVPAARNCEVTAEIHPDGETISIYSKTPVLSHQPCADNEWITYQAVYERIPD